MNKNINSRDVKNSKNLHSKQSIYRDVIVEKDWIELIDKHKLRYEIWALLKLYNELNVTEISRLIKHSKSTVSRVLIAMKKDELVTSRRGIRREGEGEKIPPKFYRIDEENKEKIEPEIDELELFTDPNKLRRFYISQIKNYRNAIYNYHKLLDLLTPLLNVFEDQLGDIDRAKHIYETYLSGKNEPWFNLVFFDHKHYEEFMDLRLEYLLKIEKVAREQELNTEKAYFYFDASLPLKAIFELKRMKF